MASAVLLIVVCVAVVNAGYVWVEEEDDAPPGYKRFQQEFPKNPDPVKFKPFVFKPFKPITFKPFEPITFKPIDINYKPGEGETYVAQSHSTHSESSNVNGVEKNSGGSTAMLNINGDTEKEAVEFRDDPKNAKEEEDDE
uniref:Seroin transcript 1A n=1 Tax=Ephestia kuehniella TaxID=40079 RepID=A0A3G1T161_EPHKU|nr:seroin transcript 1A [Ephestia kuehniella]